MSRSGKFISKFPSIHRSARYLAAIFIFFITNSVFAQSDTAKSALRAVNEPDTTVSAADTLNIDKITKKNDTAVADTAARSILAKKLGIRISPDALSSEVKASARDSAVIDMKHNQFYLYGKAQVNYEDMQLNAGQVVFAQTTNVVTASPLPSERDTGTQRPSFKQGSEKFTYDSMQYNFRSKRAIVRNVKTQYGEGFVSSTQIKRNPDQSVYGWRSVYTTCALDTPHFGILAKKIKVIPGRVIVSGPANLQIEGVPTPLYLPFGLFPVSQRQKSGFVLPTYTLEQQRGLGLLNGGYYFYMNDRADLLMQTNFFTKGSYMVSGLSNYNSLYHYKGAFNISYAYNKTGESFEPDASISKGFMVKWSHSSDNKAIPGVAFRASVEAGTSTFYSQNSYDPNQVLRNQYQSNITFSKNWQNKPFGLTISALHNQNTTDRLVSVTLPSMNFYVNQFNPFQGRNSVGNHWYDKITTSYSVDLQNRTQFYDTALNLGNLSMRDFQNGIHQSIPISASYNIFKYLNMSFSASYNEYWLTNRIYQSYDNTAEKLDSAVTDGFYTMRDFNTSVSFSTRIYGMKLFRRGGLRGIRHVINPSVGFSYHPDFASAPFNYYYRTYTDTTGVQRTLSYYPNSIIGLPSQGKLSSVDFVINNILQIKVRSAKDTANGGFKNVSILDGFSIATNYNAAADSFRWNNIVMKFRTNVLEKLNISGGATYSPYAVDYGTGQMLQELKIQQGTGVGRFLMGNIALGTNFHSKPSGGKKSPANSSEYARIMRNAGYNEYVDFNIPWSFNVNYSLTANTHYSAFSHADTMVLTHSFTMDAEFKVTERWKVTLNTGYNFNEHAMTLTNINVYRDLHCWQMHFQTYPFGPRKSFNFTINVKSAVLQDLKLVRRRDFRDVPQ